MIRFESYGGSKLDEIGPDDLFCYIRPLQGHPEASSDGFKGASEGSETLPFFKRRLRNGCMIRFELYGGSKLEEIGPDDLFCYISKAIPRRPVMVSEGFQRGLKPCGFRGVSEGSETAWFQMVFRGV